MPIILATRGTARASILSFAWGLAESTFFFVVPDVGLTFLAIRNYRTALRATVAALAGSLIGGALMYVWALHAPQYAPAFLVHIPGIHTPLVDAVHTQLRDQGLTAMLLGPLRGTPYKIYAVEWGALKGSLAAFLLMSIPTRYVRFLLGVLACAALDRLVTPWRLAIFWIVFYVWYFWRFGW
jgi:membrane protein YqaA with SNARE-associated domain